jgi:hypothetical protein
MVSAVVSDVIVTDRENANRVYATTINTTTGGGFFFVSSDAAFVATFDA